MPTTQRTLELVTVDGHRLQADLAVPDHAVASLVVCHPHPSYGGNRFNPVVDAIYRTAPGHGVLTLRFDFRAAHGGGVAERADVVAAIDEVTGRCDGPVMVAGYSFGAAVALTTDDARIDALVAIAPPLAMFPIDSPRVPTLVVAPRHDQITDIDVVTATIDTWPDARLEVLPTADHFLAGHTDQVATLVTTWLDERYPAS